MCRILLASMFLLTGSFNLPSTVFAADPANPPVDSVDGPRLIAPQNEDESVMDGADALPLPPLPQAPGKTASSRRQWLRLGRVVNVNATGESESAPKLAYDPKLVDDYSLINDYDDTLTDKPWPEDPADAHVAPADLWNGQRLKRVLIDGLDHASSYNCEQPNPKAGPNLLPPQQATPLAEANDSDADKLQLEANEPAKVILDIRDRVGPKMFEGTIFEEPGWRARTPSETHVEDARAQLVRCIRDLAQNRQQCDGQCEFDTCESFECECGQCELEACPISQQSHTASCAALPPRPPESATSSSIPALRQASRQLDSVAELLEEQKLYERADELRGMAQQLRQQARETDSDAPISRAAAR